MFGIDIFYLSWISHNNILSLYSIGKFIASIQVIKFILKIRMLTILTYIWMKNELLIFK